MTKRTWFFQNIANMVTVLGLVLSVWLLIVALTLPEHIWLIIILAGLVGLTDFLDGIIARRLDIKSFWGGALDRLRDKIFICPILIILICRYWEEVSQPFAVFAFTIAGVIVLILLELLLMTAWVIGVIKKLCVSANQYGRVKMMLEFSIVIIWLVSLGLKKSWGIPVINYSIYFIDLILLVTIYCAIKSLEGYYLKYVGKN